MRLCNRGIAAPEALQGGFEPASRACWELGSTRGFAMGLLPAQRERSSHGLITFEAGPIPVYAVVLPRGCVNLETHKGITTV